MPSPRFTAVRAFFVRHDLLFAMLGATIILTAFIVREGFLEHVKDFDTALSQASFERNLIVPFARIEERLTDIEGVVMIKGRSWGEEQDFYDQYVGMRQQNLFTGSFALDRILRALPIPATTLNDQEEKIKEAIAENAKSITEYHHLKAQLNQGSRSATVDPAVKVEMISLSDTIEEAQAHIDQSLNLLNTGLIKETERQKTELHVQMARIKILAYILFAFGWLVGLLGKILQLPVLEAGGA